RQRATRERARNLRLKIIAGARGISEAGATPAILAVRQRVPVGHGGAGVYLALAAIRPAAPPLHPCCRPLDSTPRRCTRPRPPCAWGADQETTRRARWTVRPAAGSWRGPTCRQWLL